MQIDSIIKEIEKRRSFWDVTIEEFAPDGKWASQIASSEKRMKTAQLRKVFHELKRMEVQQKGKKDDEQFQEPRIYLLIPQMAYARARGLVTKEFYDLIKIIIGDGKGTKLQTVRDYRRFIDFMTAIVAYHKEH